MTPVLPDDSDDDEELQRIIEKVQFVDRKIRLFESIDLILFNEHIKLLNEKEK